MKNFKYLGLISILALFFISCKSREDKALETIREEMFKTLLDFESYEPIETKVDSLKYDIYGDTTVFDNVFKLRVMDGLSEKYNEEYEEAKETYDRWNNYSVYYSSYAYNRRKSAYEDMQKALLGKMVSDGVRDQYLDTLLTLSQNYTGELYGWRVSHRFRCKTKGGTPSIGDYVYFMDKKFENIYRRLDEEDFSWNQYVRYVERALEEAREKADTIAVDSIAG